MQYILLSLTGIAIEFIGIYSISKAEIGFGKHEHTGRRRMRSNLFIIPIRLFRLATYGLLLSSVTILPIYTFCFLAPYINSFVYHPYMNAIQQMFSGHDNTFLFAVIMITSALFFIFVPTAIVFGFFFFVVAFGFYSGMFYYIDDALEEIQFSPSRINWPFSAKVGFFLLAIGVFLQFSAAVLQ